MGQFPFGIPLIFREDLLLVVFGEVENVPKLEEAEYNDQQYYIKYIYIYVLYIIQGCTHHSGTFLKIYITLKKNRTLK